MLRTVITSGKFVRVVRPLWLIVFVLIECLQLFYLPQRANRCEPINIRYTNNVQHTRQAHHHFEGAFV